MPSAADIDQPGRKGNYICPFCNETRSFERDMIQHRTEGSCSEINQMIRAGSGASR